MSADEPGFAVAAAAYRADVAERDPDDPEPSDQYIAGDLFIYPPDRARVVLAATDGQEPAGFAWTSLRTSTGLVERSAEIEIHVLESKRGQGVASALFEECVGLVVADGATSIIGYPIVDDEWTKAGVGLSTKYGLTHRQEERCSRAKVEDIDEDLLQGWIDDAATKSSGYRIEQWEGLCPPDLIEQWCAAADAMADAPLDNVDHEHKNRTPEELNAADETLHLEGFRVYRTLALSDEGEAAGMTAIYISDERPQVAIQGDTGVLAAHRGHALGRWLKAANYRQAKAAHPEIRAVETYNAQSNPWMLDINIAMGFRPYHIYAAYQAPIADVLAQIESRS